ncbi:MAG: T9SS type A sorting domain-containing protein, partial [Thermodesulfovibrionia bacterium]|nr:T9SS type A sorting domain-containing protein [Thermodesulfovibrionia bacterium]
AIVSQSELDELQRNGIQVQILRKISPLAEIVDPEYHTYDEIVNLLDSLNNEFPSITILDTIGQSQFNKNLILAIKISDNPEVEEDEPAVLFDAMHHAREPVSMETCLAIIQYLLNNYGTDQDVTRWINNTEIWIVPILNPDGWQYIVDNNLDAPYWRKNLRDNNSDGVFNPLHDGVDLNRNYDLQWAAGGDTVPGGLRYRGPGPFSESETRAKRDLANEQNAVMSLTYHSPGEVIFYNWDLDGYSAPDQDLYTEIAEELASRIPKISGEGHYDVQRGEVDAGYSDSYMYAIMGTIELTVETAPSYFPEGGGQQALQIAQENIPGALYVLERVNQAGITGHITDDSTGGPLSAVVKVLEIYDPILKLRKSDSTYGRYSRMLTAGLYTVEFSKEYYETVIINNVNVGPDTLTHLDVQMHSTLTSIKQENFVHIPQDISLYQNYPNPFNPGTYIKLDLSSFKEEMEVRLVVFDLLGKKIKTIFRGTLENTQHTFFWNGIDDSGRKVPSGIYIYTFESSEMLQAKKMILIR